MSDDPRRPWPVPVEAPWIRTCQSCGNQQQDIPPNLSRPLTPAFEQRKCKKCLSADLDLGSYKLPPEPEDDERVTPEAPSPGKPTQ